MEDSSDVINSAEYGNHLIRNSLDVVIDEDVAISRYSTLIVLSITFSAIRVIEYTKAVK